MASEVMDLYIRVRTPVHVGGAQEKHLLGGIDYVAEDGLIHVLDHKKLMQETGQEQYINALSQGPEGISSLIKVRRIEISSVAHTSFEISGMANDYKSMIKEGLYGRPYIPGSSIKGAIRSVIFKLLFEQSNESEQLAIGQKSKNERRFDPDAHLIGKFENSIMRFIHCSDAYFDSIQLYNAKIFNLHKHSSTWEGGWKHQFKNETTPYFSPTGFTTAFETVPIGTVAKFRLAFDQELFERYDRDKNKKSPYLPPMVNRVFKGGSFYDILFDALSLHAATYLKREHSFFASYPVAETPAIVAQLKKLSQENAKEAPLLRLASGSGFHSITGDWQFEDHINTGNWNTGKLKYKSRRLAFETDEQGHYRFYPMGFVQLVTPGHYEQHLKPQIEAQRAEVAEQKRQAAEAERQRREEEQKKAEEARKPKMRTLREVKKEGVIDGEVVGQKGNQVEVKPFVEGFDKRVLLVRYAAGFPNGTIVEVKARLQGKQLTLQPPPKEKK
ncbi:MAG: type III-A CRISPR-associated RAMP protein Csm5 [Lewinellaceae bacterium]|nr:type III-A CRISPR-associated RAMP protein Csm5 [Phaeodactylibacter sp.]MCB9041487.1 type III-A CRISPR-associated RAMP protein Csm5 [Lewinellaceae bacterium]